MYSNYHLTNNRINMKYILNDIALRSFWKIPYAYYVKGSSLAKGLTKEEFDLLMKCNGSIDIKQSELLDNLEDRGLIKVCSKEEKLTKWQQYLNCDNRYMPKINLQITGRCNYNCLHCFNAKDNAPLQNELSFEKLCDLFDECVKCGISSFTITGGEPLIHPQYRKIIEEIYKRDMFVFDLNTNGFYITQEMLDWMKGINYYPLIKISFDGLGVHNWMRGYSKAEEKTLEAIKLCIDNGFKVKIQMNINKKNKDVIVQSCDMLDKMGVDEIRLINTTDVPRWVKNGQQYTFTFEEYYDTSLEFVKEFYKEKRYANITIWMVCRINSRNRLYSLAPIVCSEDKYSDNLPLCKAARGMMAIGSNGKVYPCFQTQGILESNNASLGDIYQQSLQSLLQESDYMKMITTPVSVRYNQSNKCHGCEHFKKCTGGCPGLGLLLSGNYCLEDKTKCIFFENNFDKKFEQLFKQMGFKS